MFITLVALALTVAAPDYVATYEKGVPFATFLEEAKAMVEDWHHNFNTATVEDAAIARAKALKQPWRILVVAEDSCRDSLGTVPFLAKLVDASPDTLSMRIVHRAGGEAVMEAHKTPDGRTATPTIVVLDPSGGVKGTLVERPAALWEYSKDHTGRRTQWYVDDHGRHAIAELLDIIEK